MFLDKKYCFEMRQSLKELPRLYGGVISYAHERR